MNFWIIYIIYELWKISEWWLLWALWWWNPIHILNFLASIESSLLQGTIFVNFPFLLALYEFLHILCILKWPIIVLKLGFKDLVVNQCFQWVTQVLFALSVELENLDWGLIGNLLINNVKIKLTTVSWDFMSTPYIASTSLSIAISLVISSLTSRFN